MNRRVDSTIEVSGHDEMGLIGICDQMWRRAINSVAADRAQQFGSDVCELRRPYIALTCQAIRSIEAAKTILQIATCTDTI